MLNPRTSRWRHALLLVPVVLTLLVLARWSVIPRAYAQAPPGLGAPIIIQECADVELTVLASDSDNYRHFWRDPGREYLGVNNKDVGTEIRLHGVPAGELILGISAGGDDYRTGSGGNPDGIPHAVYDGSTVRFEDTFSDRASTQQHEKPNQDRSRSVFRKNSTRLPTKASGDARLWERAIYLPDRSMPRVCGRTPRSLMANSSTRVLGRVPSHLVAMRTP